MPRVTASTDTVATRNILEFLTVLTTLVLAFVVFTRTTEIEIATLAPVYMFTPAVAGLIVCLHHGISLSTVGLRIGHRHWLPIAAILPVPILTAITAISIGVPGIAFNPALDMPAELGLPSGPAWTLAALIVLVLIGATGNAVLAFGEEFGWRGYLLHELAPLGFWTASLVIGTVWGLWHAPLIVTGYNYPSFPIIGVAAMTLACIAFSPLFTYLVIRADSVLPAAVFHGVFNAFGIIGYTTTDDPVLRQLVASEGGLIGVAVFGLVAAAIAVTGPPRLTPLTNSVQTSGEPGHPDEPISADNSR